MVTFNYFGKAFYFLFKTCKIFFCVLNKLKMAKNHKTFIYSFLVKYCHIFIYSAFPFQLLDVGLEGARVLVEVFVRPELQAVHEDGGGHPGGAVAGDVHEGGVACMQVAHGRDEDDRILALEAPGLIGVTYDGDTTPEARTWARSSLRLK